MTTNERLRKIKAEQGLKRWEIAYLTTSSTHAVDSWLAEGGKHARNMPASKLRLLEMELAAREAARRSG